MTSIRSMPETNHKHSFDFRLPLLAVATVAVFGFALFVTKKATPQYGSANSACTTGSMTAAEAARAWNSGEIGGSVVVSPETQTAGVTVWNNTNCNLPASFVSYRMYDRDLSHQATIGMPKTVTVIANSQQQLESAIATCMTRSVLWYGTAPKNLQNVDYAATNDPMQLAERFYKNSGYSTQDAVGDFCTTGITSSAVVCPSTSAHVIAEKNTLRVGETSEVFAPQGFSGGYFSPSNDGVTVVPTDTGAVVTAQSPGTYVVYGSDWTSGKATGCGLAGTMIVVNR